jgi:hypothetical protein
MAVNIWPLLGSFFRGRISLKKSDLAPPLERRYISVQRHVSFYILKRSPGWFVWAAPTLLRGGPYLINEENSLRGANNDVDSNPARVKSREEVQNLFYIL